jgi:hypothetical protein
MAEDSRPILPNHGRMPDSARSSVSDRARAPVNSRPILPDHGRMPDNTKPVVSDAIAPAHEETATASSGGDSRTQTQRKKRGPRTGGSNLDLGKEFQRKEGGERAEPVERKKKMGLSNPGLGRDFQRKEKIDVGRKEMGNDVKKVAGEGGSTFKVQFVPKKKIASIE